MTFFKPIRNIIKFFLELDRDQIVYEITLRPETQKLVIDLNTNDQLFEGINEDGEDLSSIGGDYSPFTIEIKIEDGLPTDRVTLFQSGEFYDSFRINPFVGGLEIEAETDKEDGDLQIRWGNELLGLTVQSKEILANYYRDEIYKILVRRLSKI